MTLVLNPALHDSPRQARLIGSMVIGYSELELGFAHVAGLVLGLKWEVLHAMEKVYSETGKIKIIHALAKGAFEAAGLGEEYHITREMMFYCAGLRNQYAHCQYARNYDKKRLEFADGDDLYKVERELTPAIFKQISVKLLREQVAFFVETRKWLLYLENTLQQRDARHPMALSRPLKMPQPPKHSSPPPRPHVRGKRVPVGKRPKPDQGS